MAAAAGVSREWLVGFEVGKPGVSLSRVFTAPNALQLALDLSDAQVDEETTLNDVFAARDRPPACDLTLNFDVGLRHQSVKRAFSSRDLSLKGS